MLHHYPAGGMEREEMRYCILILFSSSSSTKMYYLYFWFSLIASQCIEHQRIDKQNFSENISQYKRSSWFHLFLFYLQSPTGFGVKQRNKYMMGWLQDIDLNWEVFLSKFKKYRNLVVKWTFQRFNFIQSFNCFIHNFYSKLSP